MTVIGTSVNIYFTRRYIMVVDQHIMCFIP